MNESGVNERGIPNDFVDRAYAAKEAGFARICLHCAVGLDANGRGDHDPGCPVVGQPKMLAEEALEALNALRSNIIGTQAAGWSNTVYPLVAILNAAGYEFTQPTDEQMREHLSCYGGAGGFPRTTTPNVKSDPPEWRADYVAETLGAAKARGMHVDLAWQIWDGAFVGSDRDQFVAYWEALPTA